MISEVLDLDKIKIARFLARGYNYDYDGVNVVRMQADTSNLH